jgi:hypothetical protein
MEFAAFHAWQSDRPETSNRFLVRDAAKAAIKMVVKDSDVEESPRLWDRSSKWGRGKGSEIFIGSRGITTVSDPFFSRTQSDRPPRRSRSGRQSESGSYVSLWNQWLS